MRSGTRAPAQDGASAPSMLGWQGVTLPLMGEWHLAAYTGDGQTGSLRLDDEEGPRCEVRWETPRHAIDVPRSVDGFLERLQKQARRRKEKLDLHSPRHTKSSHPDRQQTVSFGWYGAGEDLATQGWGVAWQCTGCGRIMVLHLIGRRKENSDQLRHQADVLANALHCHGENGWQTWAVFGLQVMVPQGFALERASLLTGKIELRWSREKKLLFGLVRIRESIGVSRTAPANILLTSISLPEWGKVNLLARDRATRWRKTEPVPVHGHDGWQSRGRPRDPRHYFAQLVGWLLRYRMPPGRAVFWHCPQSNKMYMVAYELGELNHHAGPEVVDSLVCHSPATEAIAEET